jgi:site-specific recombinase XerD
MRKSDDFPYYLSKFLARYLPGVVGASANTVMSYRDTFTLYLRYCKEKEKTLPEHVSLDRVTRESVTAFLSWLEDERKCGVSTRNQRLAAMHSFCRFMQTEDAIRMHQYQQILSIPKKKAKSGTINYISVDGVKAILEQPDASTPPGSAIWSCCR